MYAIVDIAGQQFKIEKDNKLFVHRLEGKEGASVKIGKVLLIDKEGKVNVGTPVIKDAVIKAKILSHLKGDKVKVFKKKRRKGYQVLNGHRQYFTQLLVEDILEKDTEKKIKTEEKPKAAKPKPKKVESTTVKPAATSEKKAAPVKKVPAAKPAVKKASTTTKKEASTAKKTTAKKETPAKKAASPKATTKTAAKPITKKTTTAKKPAAKKADDKEKK